MFKIRTNVTNDKGNMRQPVLRAMHAQIEKVQIVIQGEVLELEKKVNGEWFAPVAIGEDQIIVNAKADIAFTISEYVEPKQSKSKEAEVIIIEK